MPTAEPSHNPFGTDEIEYNVYLSHKNCLIDAVAQYREEEPKDLPKSVDQMHMLVYLGEMETHTLVEKLNGMGLNGRVVLNESLKAFQRLHGKEDDD